MNDWVTQFQSQRQEFVAERNRQPPVCILCGDFVNAG